MTQSIARRGFQPCGRTDPPGQFFSDVVEETFGPNTGRPRDNLADLR